MRKVLLAVSVSVFLLALTAAACADDFAAEKRQAQGKERRQHILPQACTTRAETPFM